MKRCQFTAWDRNNFPKHDNNKYLFYEEVSTGLSKEICTYVYKNDKGFMTKDEVISELLDAVRVKDEALRKAINPENFAGHAWAYLQQDLERALLASETRPKGNNE